MMSEELKPCPCCGCKNIGATNVTLHYRLVECHDCGLKASSYESLDEAIAKWNARPAPAVQVPDGWASDVMTAAGLLAHGKRDKGLAERLRIGAVALLAAAPSVPAVCPACGSDEPFTGSCGTSDADTKALCKRLPAAPAAPAALNVKVTVDDTLPPDTMKVGNVTVTGLAPSPAPAERAEGAQAETALEQFNKFASTEPMSPLEKLRFFLSCALKPQDWLDVEPFLDALPIAQGSGVDVEKVMALVEEYRAADNRRDASKFRKEIRALLSAPPAASGWQPIETAPGKVSDVLLYCTDTNEQLFGFPVGKGLYLFAFHDGIEIVCRPTHWQPLPAAPAI